MPVRQRPKRTGLTKDLGQNHHRTHRVLKKRDIKEIWWWAIHGGPFSSFFHLAALLSASFLQQGRCIVDLSIAGHVTFCISCIGTLTRRRSGLGPEWPGHHSPRWDTSLHLSSSMSSIIVYALYISALSGGQKRKRPDLVSKASMFRTKSPNLNLTHPHPHPRSICSFQLSRLNFWLQQPVIANSCHTKIGLECC